MNRFSIPGKKNPLRLPGIFAVFALTLALVLSAAQACSAQASIAWNPGTGPIAGYEVYYGVSTGQYTNSLDAGNNLSCTLQNLSNSTYYIAALSYDANHDESSSLSTELVIQPLTASAATGGTITPSGTFFVMQGANQTFTITPSAGYTIAGLQVDGSSVGAAASYTLSNIAAGHTISATFTANVTRYTLTASAGANGAISPSGAVTVNSGASQTFSFTPATGYQVSSVLVDGAAITTASSHSFSDVTASHTISVSFAPITYTISPSAGANGAISPSGAVTVNPGGNQTFSFTPATGYQVSSVLADGTAVTAASSYTFSNVTASHTISVSFAPITYTITSSAGANGTISPSGAVTVNSGGSQTVSFTPATGYEVASVLIDGSSVGALSSYTFSSVTANHTISATFTSVAAFTITPAAGANGAISPATPVAVKSGGSQTFTIAPATGFQVASVQIDGASVGALTSYAFSNVTANHAISASFAAANQPPVADAGPDQTVASGVKVTLSGSNSTDVGGPGIASYLWAQIGGTKVKLSKPSAAVTTFTAPFRIGALTFQLTVKDVNGLQSTDTCVVNVASAKEAATLAAANAGPDQTVNEGTTITLDASNSTENEGTMVTLSGSNSTAPNNGALSYLWQQIDGPAVTLSNPTSPQLAFAAPQVGSGAVSMRFRLTVTNKYGLKSTDTCFVNVTLAEAAPRAVAGPAQTVMAGSVVTLDGSTSAAPECGIASYKWRQSLGSPATLSAPTSVTPAFTARTAVAGHYGNHLTFILIVEGADGMRTRATQVIEVEK
jgi:hypothetical protein